MTVGFASESEDCPYSAGEELIATLSDMPPPDSTLENGKHKLPIARAGKFVILVLSGLTSEDKVGSNINVRLTKIAKSQRGFFGVGVRI